MSWFATGISMGLRKQYSYTVFLNQIALLRDLKIRCVLYILKRKKNIAKCIFWMKDCLSRTGKGGVAKFFGTLRLTERNRDVCETRSLYPCTPARHTMHSSSQPLRVGLSCSLNCLEVGCYWLRSSFSERTFLCKVRWRFAQSSAAWRRTLPRRTY